jgi:hypothetical protein
MERLSNYFAAIKMQFPQQAFLGAGKQPLTKEEWESFGSLEILDTGIKLTLSEKGEELCVQSMKRSIFKGDVCSADIIEACASGRRLPWLGTPVDKETGMRLKNIGDFHGRLIEVWPSSVQQGQRICLYYLKYKKDMLPAKYDEGRVRAVLAAEAKEIVDYWHTRWPEIVNEPELTKYLKDEEV